MPAFHTGILTDFLYEDFMVPNEIIVPSEVPSAPKIPEIAKSHQLRQTKKGHTMTTFLFHVWILRLLLLGGGATATTRRELQNVGWWSSSSSSSSRKRRTTRDMSMMILVAPHQCRFSSSSSSSSSSAPVTNGNTVRMISSANGSVLITRSVHVPHRFALGARKSASSSNTSTNSNKVQVKLLKQISGVGQKGDIIRVSMEYYQNKLLPTKSATIVSTAQLQAEQKERTTNASLLRTKALSLKEYILSSIMMIPTVPDVSSTSHNNNNNKNTGSQDTSLDNTSTQKMPKLSIVRKTGPDGQLFGAVTTKIILSEIQKHYIESSPDSIFWTMQQQQQQTPSQTQTASSSQQQQQLFKMLHLYDDQHHIMSTNTIKHVGTYQVEISIIPDITITIPFQVIADK
jgi:ribosomal protein L9